MLVNLPNKRQLLLYDSRLIKAGAYLRLLALSIRRVK